MPPLTDPWYLALFALLALCARSPQKLRTWAAIATGSVMGWYLPPVSVAGYIALDSLSAALVLRRPAGLAQRMIGILFAGMILVHCGFSLSAQRAVTSYYLIQSVIGYAQLALLAAWGAGDLVGNHLVRHWPRRREAHSQKRP